MSNLITREYEYDPKDPKHRPNPNQAEVEQLREKLAAIEHERWSDWQRWMHDLCPLIPASGGDHRIPAELYNRWERQIATIYDRLSEVEKDSDREQVDRYWPLIERLLATTRQEALADRRWIELEEEHDLLWTVHRIFFPTSDVCSFCAGDAFSLNHEQLTTLIESREKALATQPTKGAHHG